MAQPFWISPAGSLGVIPEGVFYQQPMLASIDPTGNPINCTATTATTNAITCDSTAGMTVGQVIVFTGTSFGGITQLVQYYVFAVHSPTSFSIASTSTATSALTLSTATGLLVARLYQSLYYQVIAGTLPSGIQCSATGLITGVPQAVSSLQGVPTEVNADITSKFTLRVYTEKTVNGVEVPDRIADRTFTLTVTGNDVPEFVTPAGAFADNNTASFVGSVSGTTLTVTSIVSGTIALGMSLKGPGIQVGTTIVDFINGIGGTGTYVVSISQSMTSTPITGTVGEYYDGDRVELQIEYTSTDNNEAVIIRKIAGELPPGLSISTGGLISGYIAPAPNENETPGYDLTPIGSVPYDFISSAVSRNYQFTLEITDGKSSNIRTFTIFVYNREDLVADDTYITADSVFVTSDETPERAPFLLNYNPSYLGVARGENYYAYRFIGQDYDKDELEYLISVNEGFGLPPGLTLDPNSGWYYGYIPDQGVTEITYSFNIQVRAKTLLCTATTAGTNLITCNDNDRADMYVGAEIVFEGTGFGGITAGTTYYVIAIPSPTTFQISTTITGLPVSLTTATGSLKGVPVDIPSSQLYPFSLTVSGALDAEVVWLTDSDLGTVENGSTSLLKVEAVNRGGRQLTYRLKSGAFNELPQGLTLLPTGEIAGRVTFNTFAIDLGETTFDRSQSTISGLQETTWDSSFTFTVNAYAEDTEQILYKVSEVIVEAGGSGFSSAPTIEFSTPVGASAIQAQATVSVSGGAITGVTVTNSGRAYTEPATITLTGAGSGENLTVVMQATGVRDIISVFKTFTVKVVRAYNKPYQNLFVLAMPPQNDRALLQQLLTNTDIFVPEYIYRPDDPNFGLSTRVKYQHAFGLDPDSFGTYVDSLYLNHYWKNLVLGQIETAQALDADGNVIYEVVYSKIIDNLVNDAGQSVNKIVTLPYAIVDPLDGSTEINSVYPNSLINMRDQVIDVVGQVSTKLPLWMTSKQTNGRVLGFTPAWTICYTKPGRSRQVAYYLEQYFGNQLNRIDFKVDRYELDSTLSRNWDTGTQDWTPQPSLTTFDRFNTTGFTDLGIVDGATELPFADINGKTLSDINAAGGIDGYTWINIGNFPSPAAEVYIEDGSKIIFVKQENFPTYTDVNAAWAFNTDSFDELGFDSSTSSAVATPGTYDYGPLVNPGYTTTCTATTTGTNVITCDSTLGMTSGDKVWFTGSTFGGIDAENNNDQTKVYYVLSVSSVSATATVSGTNRITVSSSANFTIGDEIWFGGTTFGGILRYEPTGLPKPYYVIDVPSGTTIVVSEEPSGVAVGLTTVTGTMTVYANKFSVTAVAGSTTPVALDSDTGTMTANYGNDRMSIYTVSLNNTGGTLACTATNSVGNWISTTNISILAAGYQIYFGGTLLGGISADQLYYVVSVDSANNRFAISQTENGPTVSLTNGSGAMTAVAINYIVNLVEDTQTVTNDYITTSQGQKYAGGTYLYRPGSPAQDLIYVKWLPLITATTIVSTETIFDQGSLQFIEPVDMYDPTDRSDKYLVFPKANILA
jgi:hypothetical protein